MPTIAVFWIPLPLPSTSMVLVTVVCACSAHTGFHPLQLLTSTSGNPVRCALHTQQVSPCPFSGFSAISCSGTPMSQILSITLSYTQGSRELPLVSSLTLSVTPWVSSFLLSLAFLSLMLSVFLSSVFLYLPRFYSFLKSFAFHI